MGRGGTGAAGADVPARTRRWIIPAVIAGVLTAIGVGVIVAAPWRSQDTPAGAAGDSNSDEGGDGSILDSTGRHFVIGAPSAGWEPSNASDAIEDGYATSATSALFASAGATLVDGPWLAIDVSDTDDSGFATAETTAATMAVPQFDGGGPIGGGGEPPEPVLINGIEGVRGTTFDGSDVISFVSADGQAIRVISRGVSDETALVFASAIRLGDENVGITDTELTADLALVYTAEGIGNLAVAGQGSDFGTGYAPVQTTYSNNTGGFASLTVADQNGDDPLAAARVLLVDPDDTSVHGLPAVSGDDANGNAVLSWVESGRVITLTGMINDADLTAMADSVREASNDEWNELLEISRFGGVDARTASTAALVAAGDLQDRSNWNVVASLPDDGTDDDLQVCLEAEYTAFCEPTAVDALPLLVATQRTQRVVGLFALVEPGIEGVILRIIVGDDDPIEIPLTPIASLPGSAAGWATEEGKEFTAELVAADEAVLATITDDDMPEWTVPDFTATTEAIGP